MKVLVTGGVRSGKSTYAEGLLVADEAVVYVAPGPVPDRQADPDWADRVAAHQARRPVTWTTRETRALADPLADVVAEAPGAVLVDCLGTWLTRLVDDTGWERPREELEEVVGREVEALVAALAATDRTVVLVTNEVGLGVVPEHRSGRVFRDLLGLVNQRVAAACDDVVLVIAGRALHL